MHNLYVYKYIQGSQRDDKCSEVWQLSIVYIISNHFKLHVVYWFWDAFFWNNTESYEAFGRSWREKYC